MEYDNNCNINKKLMNPIAEKIKIRKSRIKKNTPLISALK